jgi:hypothetical protein
VREVAVVGTLVELELASIVPRREGRGLAVGLLVIIARVLAVLLVIVVQATVINTLGTLRFDTSRFVPLPIHLFVLHLVIAVTVATLHLRSVLIRKTGPSSASRFLTPTAPAAHGCPFCSVTPIKREARLLVAEWPSARSAVVV